eukprot:TRINITY_DN23191_c0_g2_i1.p1 TRINITY_DN23191_c0_g2~~TRINITY_DN23191_c0_g2_i1.p1  ORF type:complete len:952 (+),score=93.06 TRINITY_DN23191_c0_g2_i1:26-2857(+)
MGETRSYHLDNTKVIGSFCVIFGHLLYYNVCHQWHESPSYDDWRSWLHGSEGMLKYLMDGLSVVKMPTICFITGLVSQGDVTRDRVQRYFKNLVLPTLIWVFVAKPVFLDTLLVQGTFLSNLQDVVRLRSYHTEWYLQAMVIWRGSAFLIWSHLRPTVALLTMLLLSCYAGYCDFGSVWLLPLDPILGFLPYFAVGYVFPYESVLRITGSLKDHIWYTSVIASAFVLFWVFFLLPTYVGRMPDGHGNYHCCGAGAVFAKSTGWHYKLYFLRRLVKLLVEMVPSLTFMFLVVPRSAVWFSWIGPHTLYPYLLHEVCNYWRNYLVLHSSLPQISSVPGHIAVLALHVPYVIAVMCLTASPACRWLLAWCFKLDWLDCVFKPTTVRVHDNTSGAVASTKSSHSKGYSQIEDAALLSPQLHVDNCFVDRIPWQHNARWLYPYALFTWASIMVLTSGLAGLTLVYLLHLRILGHVFFLVLVWISFAVYIVASASPYVLGFLRLRGTTGPPDQIPQSKLTHVVVVVAYKEPRDVIFRTCDSIIAQEGLQQPLVIALAMEARDETNEDVFRAVLERYESSKVRFIRTQHVLVEGETIGKSSNENFAVRELYSKLVHQEGMDPFVVMITIVDADSVLSRTYLAHVDASFTAQLDGRRLLYSGPLNVFRNFGDGALIAQFYDLTRCLNDTFAAPGHYYPQSNYSLTLGFAAEIGFWTPDLMPEDIHTANKACLRRFSQETTVPVPSIICNDMVTSFGDRYTQAKRHCFGSVSECLWILSLLWSSDVTWLSWLTLVRAEFSREGSLFDFSALLFKKGQLALMLFLAISQYPWPWEVHRMIILYLVAEVWRNVLFWLSCFWFWQHIMAQFDLVRPSCFRWTLIVLLSPILDVLGDFFFYTIPFLHSLFHVSYVGELSYVVAPKGEQMEETGALSRTPLSQRIVKLQTDKDEELA